MKKNPKIIFLPLVLDFFNFKRQLSTTLPETGGYLFGSFDINKNIIKIGLATEAINPKIQKRYKFKFDIKDAQRQSDRVMQDSRLYFIGDWHTHPEYTANPSQQDYKATKILFGTLKSPMKVHLSVVLGQKKDDIYCYTFCK